MQVHPFNSTSDQTEQRIWSTCTRFGNACIATCCGGEIPGAAEVLPASYRVSLALGAPHPCRSNFRTTAAGGAHGRPAAPVHARGPRMFRSLDAENVATFY